METERKIAVSLPPVSSLAPNNLSDNAFPPLRPMHGRTSGPTRRSTRGQWTPEEDEILRRAVQHYQGKNWKKIAECFKDRTDVQCLHRWQKVLNPELIKGPWSKEEDETIVQLVNKYGPKKWSTIAQHLPGRIGKQCRERWHNHLNPAINREPWTQEEELVLIRAHQMHGNKWAELTKYLPGRTDNAIKNHWNSSVKKKLDSFLASGLLAQFQGLPLISHQNESSHGASLREHCSNGDGADPEENSESTQVGVSQTASEISNTACQTGEELLLSEESNYGNVQVTSAIGSCSGQYYMSFDDVTFTIPNIPCEFRCPPKYLDTNFSKDPETFANGNCNFDLTALQNMALELTMNTNNLSDIYELAETRNDGVHGLSHLSTGYDASSLVNNMALESEFSAHELDPSAESCSQVTLSQEGHVQYPSSVNLTSGADIIDMGRYSDSLGFQSSFQVSEVGGTVTMEEASQYQNFPSTLNPMNENLTTSEAHEVLKEVVANAQDHSASPSDGHIDVSLSEQKDLMDSSKLVQVDTFGSETLDSEQTHTSTAGAEQHTSKEEAGTLCYEPPRFPPTLNIPFFSCDLAQSCTDGQQDFSPLGIRQLMMSSMNCLTPFKLWDSPSSDDSPDAVLKSSSKTCSCTPSILKKRRRDLLSPLSPFSERRFGRKISDINQGLLCTSKLTKEFSRLDVVIDDANAGKELPSTSGDQNDRQEVSVEEREDICSASQKEAKEKNCNKTEDKPSEVDAENNERKDTFDHHSTLKANEYEHRASETPRGILVECHSNSTNFSSPSGAKLKAVPKYSEGTTEVHQNSIHAVGPNKDVSSSQSASAVSSLMVDSLLNEVGAENLNIFGGTPFRRSIESPSAWKSPWYFSSLVPCSRFDSDIMLEDIGIFMSPGEKSIDALSLMKQINEQNADAYEDAKKVLGSDTPDSILRQRCFRNPDTERKTEKGAGGQSEGRLRLTECRTLDFSECGTPAKPVEKGKCRNATLLSSPSCLLKNYR